MAGIKKWPTYEVDHFPKVFKLDNVCFFERCVCAVLCDGSKSLGRNLNGYMLIKFSNKNALLVEVWRSLGLAGRIKLRRTSAVAVFPSDLGFFTRDFAFLCHICFKSPAILPWGFDYATPYSFDERV